MVGSCYITAARKAPFVPFGQCQEGALRGRRPLVSKHVNCDRDHRNIPMSSGERAPIPTFGTKLEGIDYVDRPGVYAVTQNNLKQIAVIETSDGYFLPGGGMAAGETYVDALKREIREEIGYQASVLAEIGETVEYIQASSEGKHYQIRSKFYKVQLGSKVGEGAEQEHRLVWVGQEDAIELLKRQGQAWAVQRMVKKVPEDV